jgi:PTH1 family peptidyl-tRNA hydrolase
MVVQRLIEANRLTLEPEASEYIWAQKSSEAAKIILAMPKTYMNRSGAAARVLLQEHNLKPSQMLVVVDDINLPLGRIRIRRSGSEGGHNGLESIIETLETDCFPRLRLGIGPLPESADQVEFVLGEFSKQEIKSTEKVIALACEAVMFTLEHDLDEAMTIYNQNPA